ncbi:uncharacterized protein TrAtP1_006929 [Trichoderma atroviride]|uniref:uncharacterized protein n=1 Tax=Hypocrea atroviridis TaxID=63577 RepID=UPI003316ED7D|nr:hypothetical protein TrAtP1_006929 [Trichoderma atroviride]
MNPNNTSTNSNSHLSVQGDEVPPPPYSETDVYSNSNGSRSPRPAAAETPSHGFVPVDDAASSTADDVIYTPPLSPQNTSDAGQSAASLYFERRPVPQPNATAREPLVHAIEVNDASRPDDFPYQNDWAARDISALDWSTFVNFLLPDHSTRQNEAILHRKLRDEMQSNSGSTNDTTSQVEAQLGRNADAGTTPSPDAVQRRRNVEATVLQWNDGFFNPRGIQVNLEPRRAPSTQMPGAWETNVDQRSESAQSSHTAGRSEPSSWSPWSGLVMDENGIRLGNSFMDESGIRLGNSFVADSNGLRIGNLIMDDKGIRYGNSKGPSQQQSRQPTTDAGQDVRGRAANQGSQPDNKKDHKRSSSCSSVSSLSSMSSVSSIGSLPSYDDVPQRSIQVYLARLQDWTDHPEQYRSKQDVKQLKADLKSVPMCDGSISEADKKALKAQIKALASVWRQIKKTQRKERRALKKERRAQRRAEWKEKRQHKKEMRKAEREARKEARREVAAPPPPPATCYSTNASNASRTRCASCASCATDAWKSSPLYRQLPLGSSRPGQRSRWTRWKRRQRRKRRSGRSWWFSI